MGLLIEGQWFDRWYDTQSTNGRFVRSEAQFRNWITKDGTAGPTGEDGFKAEPGRYHLYVSLACPWAHRTLIFRSLKGLESMITVSVVHPLMAKQGWTFEQDEGTTGDALHGADHLHQIYCKAQPDYTGRVTVPVLWDKQRDTIVSNESADIIRMLNSTFDHLGATPGDFYPKDLRAEINDLNDWIYDSINNGVYKAGFATTQEAYVQAVYPLFDALEQLEKRLAKQRYLLGNRVTEADWRLFTTLIRFDAVYHGHFKCNLGRVEDYPNLWGYVRELYQWPGVASTVNMQHIKDHYYRSHLTINPTGIVPAGPRLHLQGAHGRDHLAGCSAA
ncbi:glutathione S-transferase family protein [Marinobacterium sedimentorum]|uniref:glutathione S-transferase family protein n=1 Tax=Marinobacterium sedimentorum TaxID=2927804 RepID=UPI0020C6D536|nr:glutathione S-transferase family protein [Marinobacterium sedimentorum]MCP8688710.1 glutathione S-transferase family protein [Marinobacterium sedimentorum]